MKKKTILKEASVLLIATLMVLSSVVAMANTEETPIDATCLAEPNNTVEELMIESQQITMVSPEAPDGYGKGRDVLWDQYDTDGSNGLSHMDGGSQRALLDDFEVPAGEEWTLTDFHSLNVWDSASPGTGTDFHLEFWSDAGGSPGAPLVTTTTVSYAETVTGRIWFSRDEFEIEYVYDPVVLTEGVYWIYGFVIGGGNNCFWMARQDVIWGSECWCDYTDYPPMQPGSGIFGSAYDLAFQLTGTTGGGSEIVWDNGMNYENLGAAQWDETYPFDAYLADDFHFEEDTLVNDVHWIGGYWGGDPAPFDWCISFSVDDGTGNAPLGHPQTPSYAGPFCYAWDDIEKVEVEPGYYEMFVYLPEDILFTACEKYWISIWGVGAIPPQSGWGMHTDPIIMHQAVFGSDYFGFPFWTDSELVFGVPYDMCFQLTYGEEPEPEGSIDVEKYVFAPGEGPCDYTICLEDTYGDGWNGGFIDVYLNGVYYDTYTIDYGYGPECHIITVDEGDVIDIDYTAGGWEYENYYYVLDCEGDFVAGAWGDDSNPDITVIVTLGGWVDADTEGEAVDFEICSIAEFKIVVHNDGEVPIYSIWVYDIMDDSMEFLDAAPYPDWIDGNSMEWYGGYSIPFELLPCESFEIHVWAHVVGPHCSIDENWAGADAYCDFEPFYVFDEDSAWIHCVSPDTEPPVTTIEIDGTVGDNNWFVSDVEITITATDDLSGVAITYYSLDSAAFVEYTGPITVSDDGEHTIAAYSVDNAGNVEDPPVEDAFKIDQTDPTIELTWDEENSKLVADVYDGTSGVAQVEFFVNGASIGIVTTAPYEMEYDAESGDTAHAIVHDKAGNSAESDEIDSSNNLNQQSNPVLRKHI